MNRLFKLAGAGFLLVFILSVSPAYGADPDAVDPVDLKVNRSFADDNGRPTVLVTITNNSNAPVQTVVVKCVWFMGGEPVAMAETTSPALPAGESDYLNVMYGRELGLKFEDAKCRILKVYRK